MNNFYRNVSILSIAQAMMNSANALQITAAGLIGLTLADNSALATLPLALQFIAGMLTSPASSLLMGRIGRRYGFMLGTIMGASGAFIAYLAVLLGVIGHASSEFVSVLCGISGPELSVW